VEEIGPKAGTACGRRKKDRERGKSARLVGGSCREKHANQPRERGSFGSARDEHDSDVQCGCTKVRQGIRGREAELGSENEAGMVFFIGAKLQEELATRPNGKGGGQEVRARQIRIVEDKKMKARASTLEIEGILGGGKLTNGIGEAHKKGESSSTK